MMKKTMRKTPYHHGNLRAALIERGLELIEEKGIRALTLREIGARLGVSRSAAYGHFKDKVALLSAISDAGFVEFAKRLEEAKEGADGFAEQLDAMALAYARFANEHRAHFEVMFHALLEAGDGAAAESGRVFTMLKETICQAQERGEVRPGDPDLFARTAWALVHGASMLRRYTDPNWIRLSSEVLRFGLNDRSG
jgi:AcrR family transcriptional regulator